MEFNVGDSFNNIHQYAQELTSYINTIKSDPHPRPVACPYRFFCEGIIKTEPSDSPYERTV
jgi:hypothetical protein